MSPLNLLKTMQLKELPLVALHWHAACTDFVSPARLMIAIPGAVSAQNPEDQAPDRFRC
jgi:hypothetical protein